MAIEYAITEAIQPNTEPPTSRTINTAPERNIVFRAIPET
jgi:hypothetical protein